MNILVCGGRDFADLRLLQETLEKFVDKNNDTLILGGARGADELARLWAQRHGVAHRLFPANWRAYGRAAGPIRNREMLKLGQPGLVLAFPGGKGTADMCAAALQAKVRLMKL